jgi:hypothetical protein
VAKKWGRKGRKYWQKDDWQKNRRPAGQERGAKLYFGKKMSGKKMGREEQEILAEK